MYECGSVGNTNKYIVWCVMMMAVKILLHGGNGDGRIDSNASWFMIRDILLKILT